MSALGKRVLLCNRRAPIVVGFLRCQLRAVIARAASMVREGAFDIVCNPGGTHPHVGDWRMNGQIADIVNR